ncbi:alpha/beta fold hydrolase [Microbacterium elymi]|uniref:alpha/beta fold hydrolase n=1 Tax=Microbacterium elymi TaxID=2909587 RepID=UPI003F495AD5
MTVFDGIAARIVETPRLGVNILERTADDRGTPSERTVVFVHGNVSSALFWQEIMEDLPGDIRPIAVDLRGFGGTESLPVDATRGVRDFADDLDAVLQALELDAVHLVGWSMGGGVIMQYALDHPVRRPHAAGAGLAVRVRRHPPRRHASDRR